jgi:Ca2+-binding RTX toxin-like protein
MKAKFAYLNSLLLVMAAVLGTTTIAGSSSNSQAWADLIEGTDLNDSLVGTPGDDLINSKGGEDENIGDSENDDGFGNDIIVSGEREDTNEGDASILEDSSGNDIIVSGEDDDTNSGSEGSNIFVCGEGEDTVEDFNPGEGDIATPDCENI